MEFSDIEEMLSPRRAWKCDGCGAEVEVWDRGGYDVSCVRCGAQYNAFGQRLRTKS